MVSVNGGSSTGATGTGWFVEVDARGHTHRPSTMDDPEPERNPTANGLPTITIPVRKNDKWSHPAFEDAPMRVWYDGERQPIDRLESREQTETATVLRGRGGLELKRRYRKEVRQQPTAAFVGDAITETTDYAAHVDAPETSREDGLYLDGAQRDGGFRTRLTPAGADPIVIGDGAVRLAQTCYPQDAVRDGTILSTDQNETLETGRFNGGAAAALTSTGDKLRFVFQTETDIPAEHVGIHVRDQILDSTEVVMRWDSTTLARIGGTHTTTGWREYGSRSPLPGVPTYEAGVGTTIKAGEVHTLEFEATGEARYFVDVAALYDDRYEYSWPNPVATLDGGTLAGPELYPPQHRIHPDAPAPSRAVVGGTLDVSIGAIDDHEADYLGLSNTQREDRKGVRNANTFDVDFGAPGPSLQPTIGLKRVGNDPDRRRIPTKGFETQRLTGYALRVDVEDIPLVVNQSFDGALVDVLSSVADDANSVFEYRRSGGDESIEWTQIGERTAARRSPSVANYSVTSTTANRIQKAVVYGGTRPMRGEVVVILDGEAGKDVDLAHSHLKQGSVEVTRRNGATMRSGTDYTVRYQAGVLETKASGRMDEGTEYRVDYSYQTYGEYADPSVASPRETVENATGITSDFAARQVAKLAVERLQTPVEQGTITLTGDEIGYSVVEALAAADIPGGAGTGVGGIQIKEITNKPGSTELRLGTHRTFADFVSETESNLSAVEREL